MALNTMMGFGVVAGGCQCSEKGSRLIRDWGAPYGTDERTVGRRDVSAVVALERASHPGKSMQATTADLSVSFSLTRHLSLSRSLSLSLSQSSWFSLVRRSSARRELRERFRHIYLIYINVHRRISTDTLCIHYVTNGGVSSER